MKMLEDAGDEDTGGEDTGMKMLEMKMSVCHNKHMGIGITGKCHFFCSTMGVWGIKFTSLGLVASTLPSKLSHLLSPSFLF